MRKFDCRSHFQEFVEDIWSKQKEDICNRILSKALLDTYRIQGEENLRQLCYEMWLAGKKAEKQNRVKIS